MTRLDGWGGVCAQDVALSRPATVAQVREAVTQGPLIARGMGRAYGDAALAARVLDMLGMDRMIDFDESTGLLTAEAGVTLARIIEAFLPRGWFPLVTPGTKFVSLGGALAADVHGKNHHLDGSFRACVRWIDVMDGAGVVHRCSAQDNAELFHHTIGGMGLTGVILAAQIQLQPVESGWIAQTTIPAPTLESAIDVFEANLDARYSVAWIDCLATGAQRGRSLVMLGRHAVAADLPPGKRVAPLRLPARSGPTVPFTLPGFTLNRATVRAFNALYWWNGRRKPRQQIVDWDSYFYPLDAISQWNRIYGRAGFRQFQCALPLDQARAGLAAILDQIAQAGRGSFLAVLKRFGAQAGPLSFPTEGYTLALDFTRSPADDALVARLHDLTVDHGGRFYLAKDSHLTSDILHRSDPRWSQFHAWRQARGLDKAFASTLSNRLIL